MRLIQKDTVAELIERRKSRRKRIFDPRSVPLEHEEQRNLISWAFMMKRQIPALDLLFAIPNQGAARLKNLQTEGCMKGVPDLFLAVAKWSQKANEWCSFGLFIEMKRTKGGKVSAEQYQWIEKLTAQGYQCVVARGADEARKEILEYLGIEGS